MSDPNVDAPLTATAELPAATPYGLGGLVLSVLVILLATAVLSLAIVAAGFAAALAVLGYQQVVDRITDLNPGGGDVISREKIGIVVSLIVYAALSLVVLAAARLRGGQGGWPALVAWRRWKMGRGALWVWGLAALMIVYSLAATTALAHFFPKFDAAVHLPDGRRWALAFLLLAAVCAPIGEEILFRGWIYTSLRASFGIVAAMIAVSVLFALAHWEKTHLYALAVFPVGLGLAWIRERTGSIMASIIVHGIYNGVASALLFLPK